MSRLNYSFYLLKVITKKWGLYLTSLISFVVIIVTYMVTIKKVADDNLILINQDPTWIEHIQSGLISKQMNLVLVFISLVPFVIYLCYTLFKSDHKTQLVLSTKNITRISLLSQKIATGMLILFLNSLLSLIAFASVAVKDDILSSYDSRMWFTSMFFGYFIASIFVFFFSLLLLNFMKIIPTFLVVMSISVALPMATVVMEKERNIVNKKRIGYDQNNIQGVYELKPYDESKDTLMHKLWDYSNEQHRQVVIPFGNAGGHDELNFEFTSSYTGYNMGSLTELKKTRYAKYAKWDSWSGLTSVFNIFSTKKSSIKFRGSWTETKKVGDIIEVNNNNSILIGGRRCIFNPFYNEDNSFEHVEANSHLIRFIGKTQKLKQNSKGVYYHESDRTINYDDAVDNYNAFVSLLKTNDNIASEYKALSFAEQSAMFTDLIKNYDTKTMTAEQMFHSIKNDLSDVNVLDWFVAFGQINAFKLSNTNLNRFSPNFMFPQNTYWRTQLIKAELTSNGKHDHKRHPINRFSNMIYADEPVYTPHYNEEIEVGDIVKVIWLTLFVISIPISILIYTRKDIK